MTISRIKDKLEVVNFRGREDRMQAILKKRIRVYGIVQGVGFGPTVDRLAHEAGIERHSCKLRSLRRDYGRGKW